jgi:hypothetical protein
VPFNVKNLSCCGVARAGFGFFQLPAVYFRPSQVATRNLCTVFFLTLLQATRRLHQNSYESQKNSYECFSGSLVRVFLDTSFVAVPGNLRLHQNSYESLKNSYQSLKNLYDFSFFLPLLVQVEKYLYHLGFVPLFRAKMEKTKECFSLRQHINNYCM